jgi:hypothetical protein
MILVALGPMDMGHAWPVMTATSKSSLTHIQWRAVRPPRKDTKQPLAQ